MNVDFARLDRHRELTVLPPDLAVLMVGVSARQAASPTAARWARMAAEPPDRSLLAPAEGSFNAVMAASLTEWKS